MKKLHVRNNLPNFSVLKRIFKYQEFVIINLTVEKLYNQYCSFIQKLTCNFQNFAEVHVPYRILFHETQNLLGGPRPPKWCTVWQGWWKTEREKVAQSFFLRRLQLIKGEIFTNRSIIRTGICCFSCIFALCYPKLLYPLFSEKKNLCLSVCLSVSLSVSLSLSLSLSLSHTHTHTHTGTAMALNSGTRKKNYKNPTTAVKFMH